VAAGQQLMKGLDAAAQHSRHLWRDSPPVNRDGTVNAYIEIPRGERRKFEFDMVKQERFIDRVMPDSVGGYPVNYGFVPQTVSYDGDPFDALVLGPPLPGATTVRGAIVGLMHM
jgi:inorganic pyrophosphatase